MLGINTSISYKKHGRRCGNELPMTPLCSRCALSPREVIVSLRTVFVNASGAHPQKKCACLLPVEWFFTVSDTAGET